MIDALNKTEELVGHGIKAWDFEPRPGRPDHYVVGIVVDYHEDRDLLEVRVNFDSLVAAYGEEPRETIFTPPFGHMFSDTDPVEPGHKRIEVTA
jgi:hypothetical protein